MGKRGPPPTPTHILKVRGSWRAKIRGDEPAPPPGRPVPPEKFPAACRAIWETLTAQLEAMQLLCPSDGWQLERYCRLFVRWRRCESVIDVLGFKNAIAESKESRRLDMALKQIEKNFCLTPADRARMAQADAAPAQIGKGRYFA